MHNERFTVFKSKLVKMCEKSNHLVKFGESPIGISKEDCARLERPTGDGATGGEETDEELSPIKSFSCQGNAAKSVKQEPKRNKKDEKTTNHWSAERGN